MMQNQISKKKAWDYVRPAHVEMFGPDIINPEKRARWCQAILSGGNILSLWNQALELKLTLLSACALKEGQNVMLIGQHADESGIVSALQSLLSEGGSLNIEEIAPKATAVFSSNPETSDKGLKWDFKYFDSLPDKSLDCIILFNAVSYMNNVTHCVDQIARVLRDDGRIVVAEAPLGGKDLTMAADMDAHLEGFLVRILEGIGIRKKDLPHVEPEELLALFKPIFPRSRVFSWQGLHLICGQKGGDEGEPTFAAPKPTEAVQSFITTKPSRSPWAFLTPVEIDCYGQGVTDAMHQKLWGRALFFTDNLNWMWAKADNMRHVMYSNLRARPGDRVLVIGEKLEALGFLPELRKRIGEKAEIAAYDMLGKSHSAYVKQWELGPDVFIKGKHKWDYPFADGYPEENFDLIWLPQGVHHAGNWQDIAQRLLRVLKIGGQVLMAECRTCPPEFHAALKINGLMRCIAEKIFWGMDTTFEEMPDYSALDLTNAFGDSLVDTFHIEWKGFLVFWGYKK